MQRGSGAECGKQEYDKEVGNRSERLCISDKAVRAVFPAKARGRLMLPGCQPGSCRWLETITKYALSVKEKEAEETGTKNRQEKDGDGELDDLHFGIPRDM